MALGRIGWRRTPSQQRLHSTDAGRQPVSPSASQPRDETLASPAKSPSNNEPPVHLPLRLQQGVRGASGSRAGIVGAAWQVGGRAGCGQVGDASWHCRFGGLAACQNAMLPGLSTKRPPDPVGWLCALVPTGAYRKSWVTFCMHPCIHGRLSRLSCSCACFPRP